MEVEKTISIVKEEFSHTKSAKILIFTQFRDTAALLVNALNTEENTEKSLSEPVGLLGARERDPKVHDIKAALFIGQASNARTKGLSQKEQRAILDQFRAGEINVLCATSIGEEGLDIPEVNAVIFYEPIPSAIRKIQRAGRTARHAPGKLFILVTTGTKDEINHYASTAREKKMYKTIDAVKKDLKARPKSLSENLGDFI